MIPSWSTMSARTTPTTRHLRCRPDGSHCTNGLRAGCRPSWLTAGPQNNRRTSYATRTEPAAPLSPAVMVVVAADLLEVVHSPSSGPCDVPPSRRMAVQPSVQPNWPTTTGRERRAPTSHAGQRHRPKPADNPRRLCKAEVGDYCSLLTVGGPPRQLLTLTVSGLAETAP